MTRPWIIDLLTAISGAAIVAALVIAVGGPGWAALGFALVVYLAWPSRRQAKAQARR